MIARFDFKIGTEYIKIHGLQRTGTNYVAKILGDNLQNTEILINAGGWKHGHYCAPWTLGQEVHVVTITKNPYAWLVSLYNYWKNGNTGPDLSLTSFEEFVRSPAVFEESAGTPYLLRSSNPVQHWNNMNFHWMSIRMNQKINLVIPYEIFLENPHNVTEAIANEFKIGLQLKFKNCENVCEPGEEAPKVGENVWKDKGYYVDQKYMSHFSQSLLQFVNEQLDPKIMQSLGYQKG